MGKQAVISKDKDDMDYMVRKRTVPQAEIHSEHNKNQTICVLEKQKANKR